ncbi:MAG: hypothetical protein AB7V46_05375 [Thermomicrobiales bacterium]
MNLELSIGPEVLPTAISEQRLAAVPRLLWDRFEQEWLALGLPPDLRLTAYWSLRLMEAGPYDPPQSNAWQEIPGFRFATFGFLDPETEFNGFGVTVMTVPSSHSRPPRLPDLVIDGFAFPVVVREVSEIPHAPNVVPSTGSTGCWAKSRCGSPTPVGPGVLTAKHYLGNLGIGASVALSDNTAGTVLDLGPDGIDAAIVWTSEPAGIIPLSTMTLVPPWLDVEFTGQSSGYHQTKVTQITDTRGVLSSYLLPSRVFLADYGRGGDSGSLVKLIGQDVAVGIYGGTATDPSGRSEGWAQHAHQAALVMDMELYA